MGKAGLATTVTGGGAAMWGGFTMNELAMIVGGLATIIGLLMQVYSTYDTRRIRRAKERREIEWHHARMKAWRDDSIGPKMREADEWEEEAKRKFEESSRE